MVDYNMEYTINLKFGENEYPFKSSDLFIIRDWLRDNDDDWYDSLPNIDPKVKEVL
jgi:hypothetical protein